MSIRQPKTRLNADEMVVYDGKNYGKIKKKCILYSNAGNKDAWNLAMREAKGNPTEASKLYRTKFAPRRLRALNTHISESQKSNINKINQAKKAKISTKSEAIQTPPPKLSKLPTIEPTEAPKKPKRVSKKSETIQISTGKIKIPRERAGYLMLNLFKRAPFESMNPRPNKSLGETQFLDFINKIQSPNTGFFTSKEVAQMRSHNADKKNVNIPSDIKVAKLLDILYNSSKKNIQARYKLTGKNWMDKYDSFFD